MVAAFLMYSRNLDRDSALDLIRQARPSVGYALLTSCPSLDVFVGPHLERVGLMKVLCTSWRFIIARSFESRRRTKISGPFTWIALFKKF